MARALITVAALSLLSFAAAAVLGVLSPGGDSGRPYHLLAGLFATLLATFVHCMVMFHFIGTAKAIREAAADLRATQRDYARETRRLAAVVHPMATLAIAATIVAAIFGGAVRAEMTPPWVHLAGSVGAVAVNVWVFAKEIRAARTNAMLIDELEEVYARRASASSEASGRGSP
jgi:hypothetical protein